VALVITVLVMSAAIAVAVPASRGAQVLPEHADVQQRLRTVLEALGLDVANAASGAAWPSFPRYQDGWPAILPCGWGGDPVSGASGPCARTDVLSVVMASRALVVETAADLSSTDDPLVVHRPQGCAPGQTGCQFDPGDAVIVADGRGATDTFDVTSVSADGAVIGHGAPFHSRYRAGAGVTGGSVRTYYARDDPATGGLQLRRLEGGADQPVADHLSGFSVEYAGRADAPALEAGPNGVLYANYGPSPTLDPSSPPGVVRYLPSCAFDVVDGVPVSTLPALAPGADGLAPLPLPLLADGPWCPDALADTRVDADLYRVVLVRVHLRAQSPRAWHRGGVGAFFARAGTARDAGSRVPDVAASVAITRRGAGR
jgi:hypothetical protein